MGNKISVVKVFSTTKSKGRESLGEQVTAWIAAHPRVRILRTVVALTSDRAFHCLSIVLIGSTRIEDEGSLVAERS